MKGVCKYRSYNWEPRTGLLLGSFDGYADSIESAIYLVNREPVPETFAWIDSEMKVMMSMQRPDGHVEDWYGEGNYNRTVMLWALMKSQGVRPRQWLPGMKVGAVRDGARLYLSLELPSGSVTQFDFARHKRVLNLDRNYVRLNEFPEWYVVDENTLYRLTSEKTEPRILLGSELILGVAIDPGNWVLEPVGPPPYARPTSAPTPYK